LEAALVLPVLISLTFGCIEFGYFLYTKNTFQGAAREGARAGITPTSTNTDVTTAVTSTLTAAGLQNCGYTTLIESPLGTSTNVATLSAGSQIYVTVRVNWSAIGVRPLGVIPATKQVTGIAVMRKE